MSELKEGGMALSELPRISCQRTVVSSDSNQALEVGDIFAIECPLEKINFNTTKLRAETKIPHQLKILKSEILPDGRLQLQVVSYRVGDYRSEDLVFTDGIQKVKVDNLQFKVVSVIDPKNPPKGLLGPMGGHILFPPFFYLWGGLALLLGAVGLSVFNGWRRYQRRKLIEDLKKHDIRQSPQNQLHSRFRALERQGLLDRGESQVYVDELQDILKIFIIRQFKIPALHWSDRLIISDFKTRFRFLGDDAAKELSVLLRETGKLKQNKERAKKDIEQLSRRLKRWADKIDRSLASMNKTYGRSEGVGYDLA